MILVDCHNPRKCAFCFARLPSMLLTALLLDIQYLICTTSLSFLLIKTTDVTFRSYHILKFCVSLQKLIEIEKRLKTGKNRFQRGYWVEWI